MEHHPNVKRLADEGMIVGAPEDLHPDLKKKLEDLSDDEITHLINVKKKLGDEHTNGPKLGIII